MPNRFAQSNQRDSRNQVTTEEFDSLWIPASSRVPRFRQKLMIVLHGRGDSLKSFRSTREEFRIPEMNYLLLNAPRKYDGGYTWYAFEPNQKNGILHSREKLFRLLAELEELGWDSKDIFFFGFSQGALMSCDVGLNYPKPLGGIIAVSGYIYFFPNWKKTLPSAAFHTPWIITHGIQDELLPIETTENHVQMLRSVGLPILWKTFEKDHEIDLDAEMKMLRKWVQARIPDKIADFPKEPARVSRPLYQHR